MELLDRYLGRAVIGSVLLVLGILLSLDAIIGFAGETSNVGKASYSIWDAVQYILLNMPRHLYEFFPLAVLLGTVLGLGTLASHGELIVIRAAGVSLLRILGAIMKSAAILIAVALLLGEVLAPPLSQYAQVKKVSALAQQVSLNTDYGLWARDGDVLIHVRRVENDGRLVDINLYTFDKQQQLQSIVHAASARHQKDEWLLQQVLRTEISQEQLRRQKLKQLTFFFSIPCFGDIGNLLFGS